MKKIMIALLALVVLAVVALAIFGANDRGAGTGNAALAPTAATVDVAKDAGANVSPPDNLRPGSFPRPQRGYGPVLIGMTAHALAASGRVRPGFDVMKKVKKAKRLQCLSVPLRAKGASADIQPDRATGTVRVSAIFYGQSMTTSKGIGLGSTAAELRAAYPKVSWTKEIHGPGDAPMLLGDRVLYGFGVDRTKKVVELLMYWQGQTCFS